MINDIDCVDRRAVFTVWTRTAGLRRRLMRVPSPSLISPFVGVVSGPDCNLQSRPTRVAPHRRLWASHDNKSQLCETLFLVCHSNAVLRWFPTESKEAYSATDEATSVAWQNVIYSTTAFIQFWLNGRVELCVWLRLFIRRKLKNKINLCGHTHYRLHNTPTDTSLTSAAFQATWSLILANVNFNDILEHVNSKTQLRYLLW